MQSIAQVVPANTWRVVGDRADVSESYIPLDGSARSMAILFETMQRMGVGAPQAAPAALVQAPAASERPIRMDGRLFGWLREMASGEAEIVVADAFERQSQLRAGTW